MLTMVPFGAPVWEFPVNVQWENLTSAAPVRLTATLRRGCGR